MNFGRLTAMAQGAWGKIGSSAGGRYLQGGLNKASAWGAANPRAAQYLRGGVALYGGLQSQHNLRKGNYGRAAAWGAISGVAGRSWYGNGGQGTLRAAGVMGKRQARNWYRNAANFGGFSR
jgi:hypothetical protein